MSLPKEPRQKMINIMYLVLTALLALNVSSEILNAFKTVNRSLENSNKQVNFSTETIMKSLKDKSTEPEQEKKPSPGWQRPRKLFQLPKASTIILKDLKTRYLHWPAERSGTRLLHLKRITSIS
jgi:hypothetical protein